MTHILLAIISLFAICSSASAEEAQALSAWPAGPDLVQLAVTLLGMLVAARLASNAFARRSVPVADVPTFPRYMTSRTQYRLGNAIFIAFACIFFLFLIYAHREIIDVASAFDGVVPKGLVTAVKDQSTSYLVIIAAMGAVYLYFLTKETEWNVLLIARDLIYRWISIPQLAGQIVAQIRFSLKVPPDAIAAVVAGSVGVAEQDFRKDPNTPDRLWAETCYMKWWLTQGQNAGDDATFFLEESFGFDQLLGAFEQTSRDLVAWKAGPPASLALTGLFDKLRDLHNRFSRLVACYMIYRNGSRNELSAQAAKFGLELKTPVHEYPLRYWIVYLIVLGFAVYVGVYVSAVVCDLARGQGFNITQDSERAFQWIAYSASNYGVALIAVLLFRSVSEYMGSAFNQTHLTTYCWTALIAFLAGPLGLTIAVHFFSSHQIATLAPHQLYFHMLRWGVGPALVSVYTSYYLDRQTYQDLPNIDHSMSTIGWRLANCFGFASTTILLMTPYLLSLNAVNGASWDSIKLRAVATGTTFCMVFALALAAQFALRRGTPPAPADGVLSPQVSGQPA